MLRASKIRRVVLLVMDGLRAEAVRRLDLQTMLSLAERGASTFNATTVQPSVTAAAMTSLVTGVSPYVHGIGARGFGLPRNLHRLEPITHVLRSAGLPTHAFFSRLPAAHRLLAIGLKRSSGAASVHFRGDSSTDIVQAAGAGIRAAREGLIFMHFPDADRAGHVHGWKSAPYEAMVRQMDRSLAAMLEMLELDNGETLLIVCSDHGGGGVCPTDHESAHPDDVTIPLVIAGPGVGRRDLGANVSLLDIPPTALWALGVEVPESYSGRPLQQAFRLEAQAA